MEKHIQRFRRSKKDAATPIILPPHTSNHNNTTAANPASTSASGPSTHVASSDSPTVTPGKPPGTPPSNNLSLPVTSKPPRKLSPFRGFHLRPSHKRARDSPPSSIPHSPTLSTEERPRTAHAHTSSENVETGLDGAGDGQQPRRPKMPRFLELSEKEILEKFSDLVWQERNRLAAASANPSPSFRWARVTGPHLRLLDRYINIQPWQNNRVRLKVPEGEVDYINASPIVLYPSRRRASFEQHQQPQQEAGQGGTDFDRGREGQGQGQGEVHRYIAMQGPKQTSQDHVWRMVVEQLESPAVIVMLTETHEAGQEKCWQYFPREVGETLEINPDDEFGDGFTGSVTCEALEDTPAGDAIELRRLVVRVRRRRGGDETGQEAGREREKTPEERQGLDVARPDGPELELDKMRSPTADIREGIDLLGGFGEEKAADGGDDDEWEVRTVYHFLYKKWPDFGVPALEDLESFFTLMRLSREKNANPSNPRIVHCSAGVGRSGTFIALEHLMSELDAGVLENWDEAGDAVRAAKAETDGEQLPDADGQNGKGPGGDDDDTQDMDDREESGVDTNGVDDLIYNTVNALREQRRTMVQADAQYLFIYQVMRKLWLDKYGGGVSGASGREGSGEPAAKRLEVDPFVG